MSLANLIKGVKIAEERPSVLKAVNSHYLAQSRHIES